MISYRVIQTPRFRVAENENKPKFFLSTENHRNSQFQPPKKLLDQLRDAIRVKGYSIRTEKVYVEWVRRYIVFHNKTHPREMGETEIETFLTYLAVEQNIAASTQNQALCALLFLYKYVLKKPQPHHNRRRARQTSRTCPNCANQN